MPDIVTDACPIRPEHVNGSWEKHFFNAFGNTETEISAKWIVRFCQERGNWNPFTKDEIEAFYNKAGLKDFWFNRLISGNWIVEKDDMYHVTTQFIARCYAAAPAT